MKNRTHGYLPLIFCLISFFISSCNKESGPTTVNGTVRDVTTNSGVADAEVGLFETDGESAFGLGGVLMEEKYSDASGDFAFNFTARQGYQYYVQAIKDQYWNNQTDNITFVDNTGGKTDVTVFLQPEGWLELHIKNEPPMSSFDVLTMGVILNGDYPNLYGADVDTIICCFLVMGNTDNRIVWFVDEGYGDTSYFEYVYCNPFDTTYYEILY